MGVDTGIINLNSFLNEHPKLVDFLLRLQRTEDLLNDEGFKYWYLISLFSSDTIVDIESCKRSLEKLSFIKDNIKWLNLDEKTVKETKKYVNDGLKIVKRDLKEFKLNNKKQ